MSAGAFSDDENNPEKRGYHAHLKPFYNHSGSIYFSWLSKVDANISNANDSNLTFSTPENQNLVQDNNPGGNITLP